MDIREEAVRNTFNIMVKIHPTLKPTLELMLALRLEQIGVENGKAKTIKR